MKKLRSLFVGVLTVGLIGCGPTDASITTSVKQKLVADDALKAAAVDANTQKGVVTLTGTTASQEMKDRAAILAKQADGVTNVVNQITVREGGPGGAGGPHGPGGMGSHGGSMPNGMGQPGPGGTHQ